MATFQTVYLDEGAARPGYSGSIHITVDDSGNIHAVYGGGAAFDDLSHKESTDNGATWGTRVLVDGDVTGTYYGNSVLFFDSASGRLGVVYHDSTDDLSARYSADGGATWSARNLGTAGTIPLHTGILVGSKILSEFCDYAASRYLYQQNYDIGADTWDTKVQITSFGSIYYPCLFKDKNGRIHLAFSRYDIALAAYCDVYYMYSDDGGATWRNVNGTALTLPIAIDSTARVYTATGIRVIAVTADGTGKIYILCTDGRIYFYDGSAWTMKTTATLTVDTKSGNAVALIWHKNALHAVFMVWDGSTNTTRDYVYAYSTDDGDTWTDVTKITWDDIYDGSLKMNNQVYDDKWWGTYVHGVTGDYGQDLYSLRIDLPIPVVVIPRKITGDGLTWLVF